MSNELSLSIQKLFTYAVNNRKIALCNQLMKCGAVVNEETIISCLNHKTSHILSQLWEIWENKPHDNSKFIEILKTAIDYLDNQSEVNNENQGIIGHIQLIVGKITDHNDKIAVVNELIIYISKKVDINKYIQILMTLLWYIPKIDFINNQLTDDENISQFPLIDLLSIPCQTQPNNQMYHNIDHTDELAQACAYQSYGCSHC